MADTEYVSSPHFLHSSFGDRDTMYIPLFETCHADKLFIYRTPRRLPVRDCIYFPRILIALEYPLVDCAMLYR